MTTSWSGRRRSFPTRVRQAILERDGRRCVLCGAPGHIADHIIPEAEGGGDTVADGQTLCGDCHDRKTREEIARGRARMPRRNRPPEKHPGIK